MTDGGPSPAVAAEPVLAVRAGRRARDVPQPPLVGLVHIGNHITQRRPVTADERVSLRVQAADLRPHRKGTQFDLLAAATVAGEEVWMSRSTYLKRGEGPADAVDERGDDPPAGVTAVWQVPRDTGRR